jgi:glycosyltransferase involved in cell wall biosynthesis
MIALARWLRREGKQFDVAYVVHHRTDTAVAAHALRRLGIPAVLRVDNPGAFCEGYRSDRSSIGRWFHPRSPAPDAIVVGTAAAEHALVEAGATTERLHLIPDALPSLPVRTMTRTKDARLALADVNPDLSVDMDEPVVVYIGRLSKGSGLPTLIDAWPGVARHWPRARLWLIGDGPLRDALYQQIGDLDLRGHIVMPGTFEDIQDILLAANVLVHTGSVLQRPTVVPEAICAGAAVLATDTADMLATLERVPGGIHLVSEQNARAWQQAILGALDRRPTADQLAAARRGILREYSIARMAEAHQALFERVVA